MKTAALFILILFLIGASLLSAQVQPSVSNLFRYGNGERSIAGLTENFIFRENLTDVKFRFPLNFTVGFRYLYDNPPENGANFRGFSRRFIEYKKEDLFLRAGNFSELYGRGLTVNLFENRGLAYDTWIDGLKAAYSYEGLKASIITGTLEFSDSINFRRVEKYTVSGGNLEYKLNKIFTAGVSYISAEGEIPLPSTTYSLKAEIPEIYFNVRLGGLNYYANWANKRTNVKDAGISEGSAIYSSLSFAQNRIGFTLEYKNYFFDERDPFERYDFTRPTRMLPFQNPPTVLKEHSYLFLSRAIHQIDFNDEVGFQLEMFYLLTDDTYLNLNASLASRHDYYEYNQSEFKFEKIERSANFLPSSKNLYSPYWEFFFEVEHSFSDKTSLNAGIARRSNILYNDFTGTAGTHTIKSTIFPLLIQHVINEDYSATIQYEFEFVSDDFNTSQPEFSNHFMSLLWNFYSRFNINVRYEFTTNDFEVSGKKDWFTIESGYRIGQSHTVSLSYGRERGGQTCSNGVCRYIQPFSGFRFTLLSTFN